MLTEGKYLMINDIAQELELIHGSVNTGSLSRQIGINRSTILKSLSSPRSYTYIYQKLKRKDTRSF